MADDERRQKPEKDYSLVFAMRNIEANATVFSDCAKAEVLLGWKKRGFGTGKINGYGGKLEKGESMEACAIRELNEESGLVAKSMVMAGFIKFNMFDKILNVHVYTTTDWTGEAVETDEMRRVWTPVNELPVEKMWPDDKHWLHLVMAGKRVLCRFDYDDDDETILDAVVNEQ